MDKVISSPLTYWGGKRWLFKTVFDLIPEGETEIFSPFLGGGSIEINLAHRGYTVYAYDNYAPLVNFWQQWLSDPEAVRLACYELLSLYSREELNIIRRNPQKCITGIDLTAFYFIHNKFAFNGLPGRSILEYALNADGDYFRPNSKGFGQKRLFSNWEFWQSKPCETLNVNQSDFESVFWIHNHHFAYVDPPYFGNESGYKASANGFNHELLRELLGKRGKWILSYNDHPEAHRLYDGYHIQPVQRCKLWSDGKWELLILSPDIIEKQLTLF